LEDAAGIEKIYSDVGEDIEKCGSQQQAKRSELVS